MAVKTHLLFAKYDHSKLTIQTNPFRNIVISAIYYTPVTPVFFLVITSVCKKFKLPNMLQEFDNTFDEPVCVNKNRERKSVLCDSSMNKRLKYDTICLNETDQTEGYSTSNDYIPKLKRHSDVNTNPTNSDVTVFEFLKPTNIISKPTTQKHATYNISNEEVRRTNSINAETKPEVVTNFKPSIMKVIGGLKRTLSQFKMQMSNLQLKSMKNDVINQYDAKDIVFIIGCIISKLKEELKDQEELLTMSYLQQSVQHNSKQSHLHRYGTLHHNKSYLQLQSSVSSHKKLLDSIPEMNNANWIQNNHNVSIKTKPQGNNQNLSLETSYTTTPENNDKITLWNQRNLESIFSDLTEIDVIKKNTRKPVRISQKSQNNNLKTKNSNFMHSAAVKPVTTIERIVPDKHLTKTKKDSVEINKLTSKKAPCVQLNYDSDVNSTCSTVPLFPINNNNVSKGYKDKNSIMCENKNKFHDRLKSSASHDHVLGTHIASTPQRTNVHYCSSGETLIIPQNTKHAMGPCHEQHSNKNSSRNTKKDLEVLSVTSSISSTFSAYIIPSCSQDVRNGKSSEINNTTIKSNENSSEKNTTTKSNGNSLEINTATSKNNESSSEINIATPESNGSLPGINSATTKSNEDIVDKKMFMMCQVVLNKLKV